jgi:hypothetical protein
MAMSLSLSANGVRTPSKLALEIVACAPPSHGASPLRRCCMLKRMPRSAVRVFLSSMSSDGHCPCARMLRPSLSMVASTSSVVQAARMPFASV